MSPLGVSLCLLSPLDGIVTLYCVAPPSEDGGSSLKTGDELDKLKNIKLWSHPEHTGQDLWTLNGDAVLKLGPYCVEVLIAL